jgi:AraC-like DNA-binding protein
MGISSVLAFTEPDQMEAAHVDARAEVVPATREGLVWHVTRVELDNVRLVRVQESGPRIRYVEMDPERTFLSFLVRPGPDVFVRGVSRLPNSLIRHAQGQVFYERTSGPTDWASLSIPTSELMAASSVLAGRDLSAPRDPQVVTPAPGNMANLLRTQTAACDLAENSPHLLATNVEVARALKQSLIDATIACLSDPDVSDGTWAQQTHDTIMRRFRRVLEEHPNRPIYLPEICAAIGVPERTLRLCCQEQLGMSPKQYLTRRRMNLVRRALTAETEATVTEIATRFGFWHLGRFSAGYQTIFDELPSTTLARRLR